MTSSGRAGWSGLNLCSSVSACVCCSARIREARAAQIQAAGLAQLRRGGHLAFVTMTMSHNASHGLDELLTAQRSAWKSMREARSVRRLFARWGIRFVRSWEVTFTAARIGGNGFHPHLHVLLFMDVEPTRYRLAVLRAVMFREWCDSLVQAGFKRPTQYDGQAVHGETGAEGLVRYLVKVQDGYDPGRWSLGREMARGDAKRSRKRSRTPFELLESAVGLGGSSGPNFVDLARWHEYEAATKGLRVIEASRGLFEDLGVADVLAEDAPEQGNEPAADLAEVPYDLWPAVVRFHYAARLLDLAEREGLVGVERGLAALRARIVHEDTTAVRVRAAITRARRRRGDEPPARDPVADGLSRWRTARAGAAA